MCTKPGWVVSIAVTVMLALAGVMVGSNIAKRR
jgi:hypothetical protein